VEKFGRVPPLYRRAPSRRRVASSRGAVEGGRLTERCQDWSLRSRHHSSTSRGRSSANERSKDSDPSERKGFLEEEMG